MVLRGSSIGGCFASAVLGTAPLPADGKEVGRGAVPKTALANSRLYYYPRRQLLTVFFSSLRLTELIDYARALEPHFKSGYDETAFLYLAAVPK